MAYYPFMSGQYSTAPGLHKLGTDFGNRRADQLVFQLDENYAVFWENKQACRKEDITKYYRQAAEKPAIILCVQQFILQQLLNSYPQHFSLQEEGDHYCFTNHLRDEVIRFGREGQLFGGSSYLNLLDALSSQVQEDLAIWQLEGEKDYLSAIHLCAPNHWAPADKIGKPFSAVHAPVADMEALRQRYLPMLKRLVRGGTFVRFAWGLSTDRRLNHHPEPPAGVSPVQWHGRRFDPHHPKLYVRVERQTLTGFPEEEAVLFTIRTYFTDVQQLDQEKRLRLCEALQSMSEDALLYKDLSSDKAAIVSTLQG